ncbi:MAG: rRNA pseudouridine synthase [Candidatus Omnitrophica bacterium]|nr:rRNA pseudouridine synthase [Candidatus Omnitrophota bacterium]
MRLNVYLARCGAASRRKADELIKKGAVQVNGEKIMEPYVDVKDGDSVKLCGKLLSPAGYVYIALNKPRGYTSTVKDRFAEKKVTDLVPASYGNLFPVGRLDKNSCGLIILTNDGQFAQRLAHPSFQVEKEYEVVVSPVFETRHVSVLKSGITDEGERLRASSIKPLQRFPGRSMVSVVMKEGKKREVRRMFEYLGYRVIDLKRVRIGKIYLERLMPGEYRNLTEREIKGFRTQAKDLRLPK